MAASQVGVAAEICTAKANRMTCCLLACLPVYKQCGIISTLPASPAEYVFDLLGQIFFISSLPFTRWVQPTSRFYWQEQQVGALWPLAAVLFMFGLPM